MMYFIDRGMIMTLVAHLDVQFDVLSCLIFVLQLLQAVLGGCCIVVDSVKVPPPFAFDNQMLWP